MSEIDQYDYSLPKERIAQHPLERRGDAKLLVVNRAEQSLTHLHVRDLPELLQKEDCLVLNDTKVVPAKLVGYRNQTRGRWQGLFLSADPSGAWRLLCKTRGKMTPGETITLVNRQWQDAVGLRLVHRQEDGVWVARPESDEIVWSLLAKVGRVPLPHYIRHGEMDDTDEKRYQTVYASAPGAVAAPTAGLHFTKEHLERLHQQGVKFARVTLHVGVGTFRPIASESLGAHVMHTEWGQIEPAAVKAILDARSQGGRCIAVGTTSVRVLETAAKEGFLQAWRGETDLFIRPPYSFKTTDALLTNFHLPRSTLLVLVRTFGGEELLKRAYAEAIEQEYRFFSYGDAMLIL
jgi:S-adenosylmethionine:tRNA ribosyltransferase-isomerase